MKKLWCILAFACVLAGCGAAPTFETVADDMVWQQPEPRQIQVALPEDTVLPVMENESGRLYICRDYEVAVQTLAGGDLDGTVRSLCGFGRDDVEILQTTADGLIRYEFVWSSAGENGGQVGRAAILSDGTYHYCVSVMAPEKEARQYQQIWKGILETVTVG